MPEFTVTWTINAVTADNMLDAAREAQNMIKDPDSLATVYDVLNEFTGEIHRVDIANQEITRISDRIPKIVRDYIAEGGGYCPFCKSENFEGGSIEIIENGAFQECTCLDCNAKWVDKYLLDDCELISNKGGDETDEESTLED